MATRTEPPRTRRELPELEEEREVDLGRYWSTIAAHWWLPAAGLAIGIAVGFLISLGGKQVYQAKATIYLGQPLSSSGVQVQSQATNPSTPRQIVTAPATINAVARRVRLKPSQLRGHVSTQAVSGNITRLGQNPLVSITVTGRLRGKIARAANVLADTVVRSDALASYSKTKIATLERLVHDEQTNLANIDQSTKTLQAALRESSGVSTPERLILLGQLNGLLQQRLSIVDQLTTNQQQLALAQDVEAPKVTTRAVATKTTARSRRNTIVVAALIGVTLASIPYFVDRIYVVDDHSSDGTAAAVRDLDYARVELIEHERNEGVGAAILTGYRRALEDRVDVTAVMAADAQMDPADLEMLVRPVAQGDVDYAKANRLFTGKAWEVIPRYRYLGNAVLSLLTKIASGYWHVADSQAGYAAISLPMLDMLDLERIYQRYGFPNDMLV